MDEETNEVDRSIEQDEMEQEAWEKEKVYVSTFHSSGAGRR